MIFSSGLRLQLSRSRSDADARRRQGRAGVGDRARAARHEHASRTSRTATAILRERGWTRILLVSSPYHMRRALLVWHAQAPDVSVVPTPVEQSQFYPHGRGATSSRCAASLQEYLAIFGVLAPRLDLIVPIGRKLLDDHAAGRARCAGVLTRVASSCGVRRRGTRSKGRRDSFVDRCRAGTASGAATTPAGSPACPFTSTASSCATTANTRSTKGPRDVSHSRAWRFGDLRPRIGLRAHAIRICSSSG